MEYQTTSLLRCCLSLMMIIFFSGQVCFAEEQSLEPVVQQLQSDSFIQRNTAERMLVDLAPEHLKELKEIALTSEPETARRIVRILEAIFLQNHNTLGEQVEVILQELTFSAGSASVSAGLVLQSNAKLRETRARIALEKLGAQFVYYKPTANINGQALFAMQVSILPEIGVGLGPPAVLHSIYLHENWSGKKEDLWHLSRLSNHRDLVIYQIKGNGIELNDLFMQARFLPGLAIQERGACLGIRSQPFSSVCEVGTVVKGGAAEKGGLLTRDIVLKLDETDIRSFAHLVQTLQDYKIGDEPKFTILRDGVETELLVQLGSWRDVVLSDEMTVRTPPTFSSPFGELSIEDPEKDPLPAKKNDSETEVPEPLEVN